MSKFKITKELSSLSLLDIITLQKLLIHPDGVVRIILYQEINQFINPLNENENPSTSMTGNFEPQNLPISSFYSNLNSLEAAGFVSYIKKKQKGKDKIVAVKPTEKANMAINGITGHFLSKAIDEFTYISDLFGQVIKSTDVKSFANLLLINLSETIEVRQMAFIYRIVDEVFLLSDQYLHAGMVKAGFDKLRHSSFYNNVIREPKDMFENAIIPEYERELKIPGLNRINLLKDVIRVVKPGGLILVIVRSSIPEIDNFYASSLIDRFKEANPGRIFTIEELQEDLDKAGFVSYEIRDFNGIIIAICTNEKDNN